MLHRVFGGTVGVAAVGFISFVAVAFQGAQSTAGKNALWAGAGTCVILFAIGVVGWFMTRDDQPPPPPPPPPPTVRADDGSMAAGGDIIADHGGHVGNVTYNVSNVPDPPNRSPELRWSVPNCQLVPIYADGDKLICNAFLWRVNLENIVEGTVARKVSVQITKSVPPLPVLPVDLHKFHDDVPPFTRSHDIRFGDPLILDVIAASDNAAEMVFLWRSDLPQNYAYVYPLSPPEKEAIIGGGGSSFGLRSPLGLMITLRAVPDPPAKIAERDYRVFMHRPASALLKTADGAYGYFAMERRSPPKPLTRSTIVSPPQ